MRKWYHHGSDIVQDTDFFLGGGGLYGKITLKPYSFVHEPEHSPQLLRGDDVTATWRYYILFEACLSVGFPPAGYLAGVRGSVGIPCPQLETGISWYHTKSSCVVPILSLGIVGIPIWGGNCSHKMVAKGGGTSHSVRKWGHD